MQTLIEVKNLGMHFGEQKVLSNISFTLEPGQIMTIIGPNGAGKSTLLKLLLGILKPSEGQIIKKDKISVGYMPQKLHLDETLPLSVKRLMTLAKSAPKAEIERALDRTGVLHLLNRPVQRLSGGELQRALLARASLHKPDLLVLDEPVQGVDFTGEAELYQLIQTLRDEIGCAVVMVSHDLHLVMAQTDQVICINHHVCCSGTPDAVASDPIYQQLFGDQVSQTLAVYNHHHDHVHPLGE